MNIFTKNVKNIQMVKDFKEKKNVKILFVLKIFEKTRYC